MAFTPAEDAYIEACVELMKVGEVRARARRTFHAANEAYDDASRLVLERGGAIADDDVSDLEYMRTLVMEAKRRGGWDDDSPLAQSLDQAYEFLKKTTEKLDAAVIAATNADQPVL